MTRNRLLDERVNDRRERASCVSDGSGRIVIDGLRDFFVVVANIARLSEQMGLASNASRFT